MPHTTAYSEQRIAALTEEARTLTLEHIFYCGAGIPIETLATDSLLMAADSTNSCRLLGRRTAMDMILDQLAKTGPAWPFDFVPETSNGMLREGRLGKLWGCCELWYVKNYKLDDVPTMPANELWLLVDGKIVRRFIDTTIAA